MFPTPEYDADFSKLYEPAEDTYVLLDTLEEQRQQLIDHFAHHGIQAPLCLEIGTGSGIITTFLQRNIVGNNGIYLTTDLNNYACQTSLRTNSLNRTSKQEPVIIDSIQCNLTTPVIDNAIDLLIFNPPYVPSEEVPKLPDDVSKIDESADLLVDLALCGGEDGMVITNKVLDNLYKTLSQNGVALILFCARNKPDKVVEKFNVDNNWNIMKVFERKAGWEYLSVWRFEKRCFS